MTVRKIYNTIISDESIDSSKELLKEEGFIIVRDKKNINNIVGTVVYYDVETKFIFSSIEDYLVEDTLEDIIDIFPQYEFYFHN